MPVPPRAVSPLPPRPTARLTRLSASAPPRPATALFVILLELLALDGRAFAHLGVSLAPWQSDAVSDPRLLDTIAAMTVNGALFYVAASLLTRYGTDQSAAAARLRFTIAPFALLHPLGYLVRTGEYGPRVDWFYAACALVIRVLSERRQRRSFYYAGLLNLGAALFLIAQHRDWFERPAWAVSLIVAGLVALPRDSSWTVPHGGGPDGKIEASVR